MSTRKLAKELGLTNNQIFYMINQGVIDPAPVARGQQMVFTEHEKWILQMAAAMRKAGIGTSAIKAAALMYRSLPPDKAHIIIHGGDKPGIEEFTAYWDGKTWRATTGLVESIALYREYFDKYILPGGNQSQNET